MANVFPTGTIVPFAGKTLPEPNDWDFCDGRKVSKTDPKYKNLYRVIGTIWGGNDIPDFKLPDLRSRFIMGAQTSAEVSGTGGTTEHNHSGWTGNAKGDAYGIKDGGDNPPAATGFVSQHSIPSSSHLPPYSQLLYIIRL